MVDVGDELVWDTERLCIIREAANAIAHLGFQQTSMLVIARRAKVAPAQISVYFVDKQGVFLALLRYMAQKQLDAIQLALRADGTLQERLERLLQAFVQLAVQEPAGFVVYMRTLYEHNQRFHTELTPLVQRYVIVISAALQQCVEREAFTCMNVETTALLVLSLAESFVLSICSARLSVEEVEQRSSAFAQLIWHTIQPVAS